MLYGYDRHIILINPIKSAKNSNEQPTFVDKPMIIDLESIDLSTPVKKCTTIAE